MNKALIFLLILISPLLFLLSPQVRDFLELKLSFSYCDKPIYYRVDTVDPKFNLTKEEFIQEVDLATKIWEGSINKDLFVYDPKGELSINLIFDERQSLTNQITQLETQVQENKQNLTPQIEDYKKQTSDFEAKLQSFRKEVAEWNNKGGAPEDVFNRLNDEQKLLQAEAERLNQMAKSLNISTQNYNNQVGQLNQTIKTFNQDLTLKPEEGIYKGSENRIEIYFNVSKTELIRTLAHELGHALGLDHINNPKSIMYYKTNQITKVSDDDIAALKLACRRYSILEIFQIYVQTLRYNLKIK